MIRQPVVAGQFYPGSADALEREVKSFLASAPAARAEPTILAMVPHAGYVYSGEVAGITLGQANLAPTVILLGPNHTGMGRPLAAWSRGAWRTPLGDIPVAEGLAERLLAAEPKIEADQAAHEQEHSLEVVVPFLQAKGEFSILPIAVAEHRLSVLASVARSVALAARSLESPVSLVVSSDMSHYVSHQQAKELDSMALGAVLQLDPPGLYAVVREMGISMCGVLPMALGLMIAIELGAKKAELAAYATSGDVSGDYERVVGYAGVIVS